MTETTGSVPSGGLEPDHFSRYVVRTFPQTLRGYSRADVDAHLRQVRGWFSLAGFEQLVADHRDEIFGSALRDAEATVEHARQEADTTIDQARREAQAALEQARRSAEAIVEEARRTAQTIIDESTRRATSITAGAERRAESLRTLASAILEEVDAQS